MPPLLECFYLFILKKFLEAITTSNWSTMLYSAPETHPLNKWYLSSPKLRFKILFFLPSYFSSFLLFSWFTAFFFFSPGLSGTHYSLGFLWAHQHFSGPVCNYTSKLPCLVDGFYSALSSTVKVSVSQCLLSSCYPLPLKFFLSNLIYYSSKMLELINAYM